MLTQGVFLGLWNILNFEVMEYFKLKLCKLCEYTKMIQLCAL